MKIPNTNQECGSIKRRKEKFIVTKTTATTTNTSININKKIEKKKYEIESNIYSITART